MVSLREKAGALERFESLRFKISYPVPRIGGVPMTDDIRKSAAYIASGAREAGEVITRYIGERGCSSQEAVKLIFADLEAGIEPPELAQSPAYVDLLERYRQKRQNSPAGA
jgi:hypothetical protein